MGGGKVNEQGTIGKARDGRGLVGRRRLEEDVVWLDVAMDSMGDAVEPMDGLKEMATESEPCNGAKNWFCWR